MFRKSALIDNRSMHRQKLARLEKVLGAELPDTLGRVNNLAGMLDRQGKYEEAESMHRQTLATKEKVLGPEHTSTLGSLYGFAHLLANRYRYDESLVLHKRACTRFRTALGGITRVYRQHYSNMLAPQEQDQLAVPPTILDRGVSMHTGKG